MLGRRGWFDAVSKRFDNGKKGIVRCCDKNNGVMVNIIKWFDARSNKKTKSFGIF